MKRKFFLRRAWTFFWVMLIPTLLLFVVFLTLTMRSAAQELTSKGRQTAQNVKTNVTLIIDNVLAQNNVLTSTTRMSVALNRALNHAELSYGDAIYVSSLRSLLTSVTRTYSYIDSVYLYFDSSDRFFSSGKGVEDMSSQSDVDWLPYYKKMLDRSSHIVRRPTATNTAWQTDVITVFQRLLLQKGCVVININIKDMQGIFKTLFSQQYETVFLVNGEGEVLVHQSDANNTSTPSPEAFAKWTSEKGTIDAALLDMDGKWNSDGNSQFLINSVAYPELDLYIVSAVSSDARREGMTATVRTFAIILCVNLCVVMLLAYITTKRSFDHIYVMIEMFENAEKGIFTHKPPQQVRDEYDIISNNIVYLFLNTTYLNTQLKEKQYRQENAELMALQLQINPHFLFNTLQTLDMEVRKEFANTDDISKIIQSVSEILKYALSNPRAKVTLREEIEYLKKYVSVQKFRFGNAIIVYYDVDDNALDIPVFRLMLQPALENSLLHGVRQINRQGYIKLKITIVNNLLHVRIIDNGCGMSRESTQNVRKQIEGSNARSIGLTNLNRRLLLHYGENNGLGIRSKLNKGTCVFFNLPLVQKDGIDDKLL